MADLTFDSHSIKNIARSIIIGIIVGSVVSLYRVLLTASENLSFGSYDFLRENLVYVPLAVIALVVLAYMVGLMVKNNSMISGSGIPQIKGTIRGYFKNRWLSTLILKFVGGIISIFAGLSLGREGPSIQLGGCVAEGLGKASKRTKTEKKIFLASGASAGLAAAFNAPLSGVMFAIEEIYKYISPSILLSTMTAALSADFIVRNILGLDPIFSFNIPEVIPLGYYWVLIVLGVALGLFGVLFNKSLLGTIKLFKKIPVELRTIIPFVLACLFGLVFPYVLGGGHAILNKINLTTGISFLLLAFALKFLFTIISFGSGAPGGIFFPLLIIGGIIGAIVGGVSVNMLGLNESLFYNFVAIAMAGYFAAIVRAPITGILLLVEMTGSFSNLLSLSVVSLIAFVVATLLKCDPIYDSLLNYKVADQEHSKDYAPEPSQDRVLIQAIVPLGCELSGCTIKDLNIPPNCLLISIKREDKDIVPTGQTTIMEGDALLLRTSSACETQIREWLDSKIEID